MIIDDGKGTGTKAAVTTTNRLRVQAITETESQQAIELGEGYNINTGNITFSAAGTLLYIKNNEDQDMLIDAIAVGVGSGTTSDIGEITIEQNPTGGDLISDATAVAINANRNFGSSKTLTADVYKGKSGGTSTGGTDTLLLYQGTNGRLFAGIDLVVPKGSSIAITYDPKLSSGSVKAYAAAIIHLKEVAAQG